MKKIFKNQLKKLIKKINYILGKKGYDRFYKNVILYNPSLSEKANGEDEWLKKWRKFDDGISPLSYRIFSKYIGCDMNILPMELCVTIVEPVLTPKKYLAFYSDKNCFDLLFSEFMPKTLLRNIRGKFLLCNYDELLGNIDEFLFFLPNNKIVLKPTLSSSGRGVSVFYKKNNCFVNNNGDVLSKSFLDCNYKSNYVLQEFFEQSDFLAKFNISSVNTIRLSTYRRKTGDICILRAGLRIGSKGAEVDNAHAGGMFCGIDDDGKIGEYVCDQYGQKKTEFNGISFIENNYMIPNYEEIKKMAIKVAKRIIHHDLIAFDVVLDKNNNPKILEINVGGFGGWFFQFTSGSVFREYTDEIMEYCFGMYKDSQNINLFL